MTQSSQSNLNRLCEKMHKAGYKNYMIGRAMELIDELQQRGVQGVDRLVRKLSDNLGNKDKGEDFYQGYLDILKGGQFARILVQNGFKQIAQ